MSERPEEMPATFEGKVSLTRTHLRVLESYTKTLRGTVDLIEAGADPELLATFDRQFSSALAAAQRVNAILNDELVLDPANFSQERMKELDPLLTSFATLSNELRTLKNIVDG